MWPSRNKGEPIWPTLHGARLNNLVTEKFKSIMDLEGKLDDKFKIIQVSKGSHYIHELENGGFCNGGGGTRVEYPVLSLEIQAYVHSTSVHSTSVHSTTGRRSPLYLIAWIGQYSKGCILHCGWQYPHCNKFYPSDLEAKVLEIYVSVAENIYMGQCNDRHFLKFIKEVKQCTSNA